MSKKTTSGPFTVGSKSVFEPEKLLHDEDKLKAANAHLEKNDLRSAIIALFSLPENDTYVYHAIASVTLTQVQHAIAQGGQHGLHDWYIDEDGKPLGHPPPADMAAYTSIFSAHKSAANTLKSFAANAKRTSLRAGIAAHLTSHRHLSSSIPSVKPLKAPKQQHVNPALDFWTWSCHALQWAGPDESTARLKTSHHVLPVFMHHFGCVVPSYECLELIRLVATTPIAATTTSTTPPESGSTQKPKPKPTTKPTTKTKTILDMGSGNGYWTFMLRRHLSASTDPAPPSTTTNPTPTPTVIAIDSGASLYRTTWIPDTIVADGLSYLRDARHGGPDDVLLLVYPIVGGDGFTEKVIRAYTGSTVCVVGTQCRNGYTAFAERVVDEWMMAEEGGGGCWEKVVQVPVPSFAGKDEALFVFERRARG